MDYYMLSFSAIQIMCDLSKMFLKKSKKIQFIMIQTFVRSFKLVKKSSKLSHISILSKITIIWLLVKVLDNKECK